LRVVLSSSQTGLIVSFASVHNWAHLRRLPLQLLHARQVRGHVAAARVEGVLPRRLLTAHRRLQPAHKHAPHATYIYTAKKKLRIVR
jgi:hypothetical protein